jgi:hypothetical protein
LLFKYTEAFIKREVAAHGLTNIDVGKTESEARSEVAGALGKYGGF